MEYMFGKVRRGARSAVLTTLQEVDDTYELLKGNSRAEGFSEDAYFRMDDNFPTNLQLGDFILNDNKLLVISDRLRKAVEKENIKNTEILPIKILNHKDRVVKEPYFILHQVKLQDCIDVKKSKIRVNALDSEKFMHVSKLVLDESRVDPDVALFRMRHYAGLPIFRRDLAEKIMAGEFSGIKFGEIEDWKGR